MYPEQRPKIGFVLEDLTPSELNFSLLYNSMEISDSVDIQLYYCNISKPCTNSLCGCFHYIDAIGFDGPLIATDLATLSRILPFCTPNPKFLFVNDLEWLRYPGHAYNDFAPLYRNPAIEIIARSNDHKRIIESAWNVQVAKVVENYNFFGQEFLDFILPLSKPLYGKEKKFFDNFQFQPNLLNL